ncbi:MAG: glycosyltransferase family 4 protein [Bacteroidota bacterium]
MKILVMCNKSPYPPREGGPIAMHMIVEGLISEGHQVKVLAVNSYKYKISLDDIPGSYREKTGIELIDVDLRIKPLEAFLNLFTGRSYHVERFISSRFRKRLIEVLRSNRFDIVQMETLFLAPYLTTVRAHSDASVVLRAHNIEHLIWSRVAETTLNPLKRLYIRHLATTLKRYEQGMIPQFDGLAAITEKDADYFRESAVCSPQSIFKSYVSRPTSHVSRPTSHVSRPTSHVLRPASIIAIPFGIDLDNFPPPVPSPDPLSLFTIGAMNWIPNAEGIRWFLHHVWPEIHDEFPSLKYYLAGREMPDWMVRMAFPNVEVLGEVPDAREFIDAHGIMIVPLLSGSGIRIKIIEGMAAGKPVLSTLIGAEGIDCTHGKNILIANAPCEFIDMISLCINDMDRYTQVGVEARKLIESTYDRRQIIRKLIAFYQQLTG